MDLTALRTAAPAGLVDRVLDRTGPVDAWAVVPGPVGELSVAWSGHGVSLVLPGSDADALVAALRRRLDRRASRVAEAPGDVVVALGDGSGTSVPVDLRGRSAFEREVLAATRTIPAGQVRSYAQVAAAVGRPGAVRAVGSALGRNPVPVLVPCHRVVRSDGSPGDYVFGAAYKARLLAAEGWSA